jgi:predicted TIM-barrel fold metal-dependent hydrolase
MRVISADSHMMEPPDLWQERLDNKYKDRAPRVIQGYQGKKGSFFTVEGIRPFPVAGGFAAGNKPEDLPKAWEKGYEGCRPSGWDPVERIKDQDIDGVEAEVLYTTLGMSLFGLDDAGFQQACFGAYNDWVAEFCSHNPKRLFGIALISLEDIQAGAKELERCAKKGMRGAMIWGSPPREHPYSSLEYDPFWAAAQDLQVPVSLHVVTSKKGNQEKKASASGEAQPRRERRGGTQSNYMRLIHEVQQSITDIIFSGVLERFPKLLIVSAENDTGWLPHFMYRADHAWEKFRFFEKEPLPMAPSEYIKRQLYATFQDDPIGPSTWDFFGADNYMWASDFPHTDSTWPNSLDVIKKDFAKVPADVTQKIVADNAIRLYRMA